MSVSATALNQNIDLKGSRDELLSPSDTSKRTPGAEKAKKKGEDAAEEVEMITRSGGPDSNGHGRGDEIETGLNNDKAE